MKRNEKEALVKLLGGVGVIILLIGIFTDTYDISYGIIGAMASWILSGVLKTYLGIDKER